MQIGDKVLVTSGRYERIETVVRVTAQQVHTDNNCSYWWPKGTRVGGLSGRITLATPEDIARIEADIAATKAKSAETSGTF